MEINEADTVMRLGSTRENMIDPKIAAHNGRVVKLMGDGALIEFPSVVDAVRCAVEIQQTMAECNEELPAEGKHYHSWLWLSIAAAALVLAVGSVVFWSSSRAPPVELASRARMEFPLTGRPLRSCRSPTCPAKRGRSILSTE